MANSTAGDKSNYMQSRSNEITNQGAKLCFKQIYQTRETVKIESRKHTAENIHRQPQNETHWQEGRGKRRKSCFGSRTIWLQQSGP